MNTYDPATLPALVAFLVFIGGMVVSLLVYQYFSDRAQAREHKPPATKPEPLRVIQGGKVSEK